MSRTLGTVLIVVLAWGPLASQAAMLTFDDGALVGATNVDVNG